MRERVAASGLSAGKNLLAKKKKPAKFSATKAVKARARATLGMPPPVRLATDPRKERDKAKHKKSLERLLAED
jgi:hypothetical protein